MLTSAQIAQMNGAFQQQSMQNMAYAGMIGSPMYGPPAAGGVPDTAAGMMGGAMNRMSAIGTPMAMGGLALAGLDPFSMALRAGSAARGFGMAGMGAAALGGAAVAGVPLMAAQYAGGQMMVGAQQQQMFNADMAGSFRFINQYGGRGFARNDLAQIGSGVRGMAGAMGPGEQMVGFEELGRLAANMGRMGMAQGVRDAREFSEKFREMVKSLKTIATEMGTSLEQAQQVMSSLRSSGVFRNQGKVATQIAQSAVAGGLSQSEITGMMGIGSQISRMIGGRGEAGSRAGMSAITNVGTAVQAGVLSEEDIYNVTGLTGAEGRRAYATNMLQQSAQFLKGGLGRRAIAAMAGKDGSLNQAAVDEFMAGGVGTGRTMQLAYQNLGKVGRANFIRNEGKLRGEVMAQMGGLAPAVVMRGWLNQRGIDVDSDDDRAMIFMQRRLGMGNDEAEQMVRMARSLPQLMRQRQQGAEDLDFSQKMQARARTTGIEGLKRKLEQARSEVQNTLQQAGADFYNEGTDMLEGFINRLTGNYVKTMRRDATRLFERSMTGGAVGNATWSQHFGGDGGGAMARLAGGGAAHQALYGGGRAHDLRAFASSGDRGRYEAAGYGMSGIRTAGQLSSRLSQIDEIAMAFRTGGQGLEAGLAGSFIGLGSSQSAALRSALAAGRIRGRGEDRLSSFGGMLDELDPSLGAAFGKASSVERARMMAATMGGAGIGGEERMFAAPEARGIYGAGPFASQGEMDLAAGKQMLSLARGEAGEAFGRSRSKLLGGAGFALAGTALAVATGGASLIFGGATALSGSGRKSLAGVGSWFADKADEMFYGGTSRGVARATGAFLRSDRGRDLSVQALSGDASIRAGATAKLEDRLIELRRRKEEGTLSQLEQGELEASTSILMAKDLAEARQAAGGAGLSAEAMQKLASKYGVSVDDLKNRAASAGGAALERQNEMIRSAVEGLAPRAREAVSDMRRTGVLTVGANGKLELSAGTTGSLTAMFSGKGGAGALDAGKAYTSGMAEAQILLSQMSGRAGDEERDAALLEQARGKMMSAQGATSDMTISQLRKFADYAVVGRDELRSQLNIRERIATGSKKGVAVGRAGGLGGVQALAGLLGGKISMKDLQAAYSKKGGGDTAIAQLLMDQTGISGADVQEDLMSAIKASRSGDQAVAGVTGTIKGLQGKADEAATQRREDAQRKEDPLAAKMEGHLSKIASAIGGTDKEKKLTVALDPGSITGIASAISKGGSGEEK